MRQRIYPILILLAFAFMGCSRPAGNPTNTSIAVTPVLSPQSALPKTNLPPTRSTISPTNKDYPTVTLTPIIPSPMVTSTIIGLPVKTIDRRCVSVLDTLPTDFVADGTILMMKGRPDFSLSIFDDQNRSIVPLPGLPKTSTNADASPDGKWFAYQSGDNLVTISASGNLQSSQPWNRRWNGIQSWLDSEHILFEHWEREPVAVDVFNPFTGQGEILEPKFVDYFTYEFELSGWYIWKLIYDQTLPRVAYMRDIGRGDASLTLYDLVNHQTLWELKRVSAAYMMPAWFPDGGYLAVAARDDVIDDSRRFQLFTIDIEGNAVQWVDLRQPDFACCDLRWSPDGRYIAFRGNNLYVLDMVKHQLYDFCIHWVSGSMSDVEAGSHDIFWSPDSTQLIFQQANAPALLVDLSTQEAVPLLNDPSVAPVAWLRAEP